MVLRARPLRQRRPVLDAVIASKDLLDAALLQPTVVCVVSRIHVLHCFIHYFHAYGHALDAAGVVDAPLQG